jgi:para-nitrobenzyl esterase
MSDDAGAPILTRTAVVETSNGPVRGYAEGGLQIFKGLRYGAPPIGILRFQPPQRPAPWREPADAIALAAPSIQAGADPTAAVEQRRNAGTPATPGEPEADEDCLFINVWTQGLSEGLARPVMVWLHGGGFANGSGGAAMYDGEALARKGDVVVVTVNHRLNVFGYLHLAEAGGADFAQSGAAGMLDIVQVLEWVRDNIAAFGGDAGNITIFGESGGGWKVSLLMAMPSAHGLFHKAIIQSGPGLRARAPQAAAETARGLFEALNIPFGDVAALQAAPTAAVRDAAATVVARLPAEQRLNGFAPVRDGTAIPADPFHPAAPAFSADIPLMIGTNKDETTLFLLGDPKFGSNTEEDLARRAKAAAGDKADALVDLFRQLHPDNSPSHLISDVQTAVGMWSGSITLAERKAAQNAAPVFMYQLTWETPVARGKLKSPHALEIPLVFDNVEKARNFVGRGEEPQVLADQMSAAWLAFARTGDPNADGVPSWPPYDAQRRATMMFDLESQVVNDPNAEVRALLQR